MYEVRCYNANGTQFGESDYFNTIDDAFAFAEDMTDQFLVDVITPNGKTICMN
jgi:hypothetical protein